MKTLLILGLLACAIILFSAKAYSQQKLKAGDQAPDFFVIDQDGNEFHFSQWRKDNPEQKIALCFSPVAHH